MAERGKLFLVCIRAAFKEDGGITLPRLAPGPWKPKLHKV